MRMIREEPRHHRKCLLKFGGVCNCHEIYTPPTIPRYQRQLMKQAEERYIKTNKKDTSK